mmetsp:Transcript_26439/g.79297  ORF Transcript_26439/g.79297 Transcript_26439/m.79297 type:complete len:297 (+) Transcript_26439:367-1257(+)
MNDWQGRYGDAALFLCVCVESLRVAQQFASMFLSKAGNCLVEGPDIPQMPAQLGCSGFVVVDPAGNLVTTKTQAFLERDEGAFRDVEARLAPLLGDGLAAGTAVVLEGLSQAAWNGKRGVVRPTPRDLAAQGRVAVSVDGKVLSLKRANVARAGAAPAKKHKAEMASVGHKQMDAEHASVAEMLEALKASKARADLKAARDEFREHSLHEEELMVKAGFGGDPEDALSAQASHRRDHARIVALADKALDSGRAIIPTEAIEGFCDAIYRHTKNFDALYEDAVKPLDKCASDCGAGG